MSPARNRSSKDEPWVDSLTSPNRGPIRKEKIALNKLAMPRHEGRSSPKVS